MRLNVISSSEPAPRLPQLSIPYWQSAAIGRGFHAIGQELSEAGGDWLKVAQLQQAAELRKKAYDDHDSILGITVEAKGKIADYVDRAKNADPAEHANIVKNGSEVLQEFSDEAYNRGWEKNPQVSRGVRNELLPIQMQAQNQLGDIANQKFREYHQGVLLNFKQMVEDTAPKLPALEMDPRTGEPIRQPRRELIEYFNAYVNKSAADHIIKPTEAFKMIQGAKENIAMNRLKIDGYNDPIGTWKAFEAGKYSDIPTDKTVQAQTFLDSQINHRITIQKQIDHMVEKDLKERRDGIKQDLMVKVMGGEPVADLVGQLLDNRSFEPADAEHILNFQNSWLTRADRELKKEQIDDPDTDREFAQRLYSIRNPLKEKEVNQAMDSGLLITKTGKEYLSKIWSNRKELKAELRQDHAKAEEFLEKGLTTKGLLDFDATANDAKMRAIKELWQAVNIEGRNPMEAAQEILERNRQGIVEMNLPEIGSMRKRLLYGDTINGTIPDLLKSLRENKNKMAPSLYESQMQLIKDIFDKEDYNIRAKTNRAAKEQKGKEKPK